MDIEETVNRYSDLYRNALEKLNISDMQEKERSYKERLGKMYASDLYRQHDIYPTMNMKLIYAVVVMCLELKDHGLSNQEIIDFSNVAFAGRRKFFDVLISLIDRLPGAFEIARKWNIQDHKKRVVDKSITYDYFDVSKDCVKYRISKCMYVEIFDAYGIRELCKIFCNTDTRAYSALSRHVNFIRHSDLSDGECCFDEVYRR